MLCVCLEDVCSSACTHGQVFLDPAQPISESVMPSPSHVQAPTRARDKKGGGGGCVTGTDTLYMHPQTVSKSIHAFAHTLVRNALDTTIPSVRVVFFDVVE